MDHVRKIREMEQLTGQQEQLKDADLLGYIDRQRQLKQNKQDEQAGEGITETQHDREICERLANMMMEDVEADRELAEILPKAHEKKEENLKKLRIEANRSGTDKLKNDFTGKQRKAARERLKQLGKKQGEIYGVRHGREGYIPAERRERERGRHWYNPFRAITNASGLGTYEQRHSHEAYERVAGASQSDISIKTESGVLNGQVYRPEARERRRRKLVIIFSGSGGAGGAMISPIVAPYIEVGATVLHASYRGFGKSETRKNGRKVGTHLCEDSIYQDGRATYDYAVNELGYQPSEIILHGYSLGGAVAAKVAADIAEENAARQGEGDMVDESQRLGGIVLHSSIASMQEAGEGAFADSSLSGLIGWIGKMGSGNFDTRSHMRRLHTYDPYQPVHYRGGRYSVDDPWNSDHLGLEATKLDQDENARFVNASSYSGNEGHMAGDGVHAANAIGGEEALHRMVVDGRNMNLN